jgi:YD repeat-containing protein
MKRTLFLLVLLVGCTGLTAYAQDPYIRMDSSAHVLSPTQAQFYYTVIVPRHDDTSVFNYALCAAYPAQTPQVDRVDFPVARGSDWFTGGELACLPTFNNLHSGTYVATPVAATIFGSNDIAPYEYYWTVDMGPDAVISPLKKADYFFCQNTVHCTPWQNTVYSVYDALGRLIARFPALGEETQYTPLGFVPGTYWLVADNATIGMRRTIEFSR